MNDLPWSVVRKNTGNVVAMFEIRFDAACFANNDSLEVRPTPSRTCKTCKWWRARGDDHGDRDVKPSAVCGRCTAIMTAADFGCNRWEAKDAAQE